MSKNWKNSYHHGDLSRALVQAARQIVQKNGVESLSLRSVSEAVNVSHTALYSHFADKNELLCAVAADGFSRLSKKMKRAAVQRDKKEQLAELGASYVEFAIDNPEIYRLMFSLIGPKSLPPTSDTKCASRTKLIDEAQASYSILYDDYREMFDDEKNARAASEVAWATVHGLASLMIEELVGPVGKQSRRRHIMHLLMINRG